jgi:hypothetical protein
MHKGLMMQTQYEQQTRESKRAMKHEDVAKGKKYKPWQKEKREKHKNRWNFTTE